MKRVGTLWVTLIIIILIKASMVLSQVDITIPNTSATSEESITIPIIVNDLTGLKIYSYDIWITFNKDVLDSVTVSTFGTLSNSLRMMHNILAGEIRISGYSIYKPLAGEGILLNLSFRVVGNPSDFTSIDFSRCIFNTGSPVSNPHNGRFFVLDFVPPIITNVVVSNITSSSVTITWITNEPSDTQVEYGLDTNYVANSPLDTNLVINHKVVLSGLQATTIYHYRVKSRDGSGNIAWSDDTTFITTPIKDVTPPFISAIHADSVTDSSAIITWLTDEASDTQVEYGLDTSYGNKSLLDTNLVIQHSIIINGLQENRIYHYRAKSKDVAGNLAVSNDQTFATRASAIITFTDITTLAGTGGPSLPGQTGGHAVAFADVDDDDRPDLYITMKNLNPVADLFFHNMGGNIFVEEGALRGLDDFDGGSHGACFADLDNDGDYDLFNGTTEGIAGIPAFNNVFRNDGNGYFTDTIGSSGIPFRDWPTRGVLAFDMEEDGDLDLFCVTNYLGSADPPGERNEIYRNDGNFKFTVIDSGLLSTALAGQGATDTDYDGDGDIDIIAANRTGDVNILNNDGTGKFSQILPSSIGITHQAGDGITMADIDNDNDLDMLLVGDPNGYVYFNNGNGTFSFKRSFSNIEGYMGGFADLDNDGDLDLVFAGDDTSYLNDGRGNFISGPAIPVSGIDDPRAIAFADIDNDGDLDFAIGCKRSRNWLIQNNVNYGNWLKVKLISPQGQSGAFGAKTRIYPAGQAGGMLLGMRESRSNNGYLGQDDPVLHFGLGPYTSVDVVVTFLDGSTATRTNVTAWQTITINGPDGPRRYHLTVNNGSGDGNYVAGTIVTISANPPPANYAFDKWIGDTEGIVDVDSATTTLIMPAANVVITAIYRLVVGPLDKTGTQWAPFLEWSLDNSTYTGNPYDLIATVTFVHTLSGETRTTEMFYDGNNVWKFRFTGTQIGKWKFTTSSSDLDLDGYNGIVTINSNPDSNIAGFITNFGNKWGRLGINEAFVPQYVMYDDPSVYYNNPSKIDADIQTFIVEHGFTGFHTIVGCRWFDINEDKSDNISIPNPDPQTFEALELLITKVHAAGGVVHIWAWGDEERRQTPIRWGKNGIEAQRLQRYIAARLGPLPGWTMGYGFDLDEWVVEQDLQLWHQYMHQHFGWSHFLGARDSGPNNDGEPFNQIYEGLDYSSYEQHKPDYNRYIETIEARPYKPSFSEDRFRIRGQYPKDYTMEETRRGLWHATMAGGVANIWGNLMSGSNSISDPYPNPEQIKTYSMFFRERFVKDMVRENSITDGVCLKLPDNTHYVFYKENTSSIQMDLSEMVAPQHAVAVDTKLPYTEIDMGTLITTSQVWTTPYVSDWVIAVGDFGSVPSDVSPPVITNVVATNITSNSAIISWDTNEPSDTQVEYGLDTNYSNKTSLDPNLLTSHTQKLTGLLADTTYHYRVKSKDVSGNLATSADFIFATDTIVTTPPYVQRVNAGGLSYTTGNGKSWGADQAYTTGSWGYVGGNTYSIDNAIANTNDDQLYQSERYGMSAYRFTVPVDGNYRVELHFAELYYTKSGQRIFDVLIEGNLVLSNLDIYKVVGANAAMSQVFYVDVMDGILDITFGQVVENPKISAIEVSALTPDVTPPVIMNVAVSNIMTNSVTISWDTDEPSDAQVVYGIDTSYGSTTSLDQNLATSHTKKLRGLATNTTYHYRVKSKDSSGNLATSDDLTFTTATPDLVPPVITNVTASNITSTGATINWDTDEPADSQVEYGFDASYGNATSLDPNLVTSHTQNLTGLVTDTTYHYRVKSKDGSGNLATSTDFTFTTGATPTYVQRVNAGGTRYVDSEGKVWEADQDYNAGNYGYEGGKTSQTLDPIANTNDDPLYQTERYKLSSYRFDVPNGIYEVRLLFAEIYYTQPQKRIMSVSIEGTKVLNNLDIYYKVGHDVALSYNFTNINVSDNRLDIEFSSSVDAAKISAIEVIGRTLGKRMAEQTIPDTPLIPDKFNLSQNYPNPFNCTTKIVYQIPEDCHVAINIYNIKGQKVRDLLDDYIFAGYYTIYWNGRDNNGNILSSGIYLYQLITAEYRVIKRMVFLK